MKSIRSIQSQLVASADGQIRRLKRARKALRNCDAAVCHAAVVTFGSISGAASWLCEANAALGDKAPVACARTVRGRRRVLEMLLRIEHGVFS